MTGPTILAMGAYMPQTIAAMREHFVVHWTTAPDEVPAAIAAHADEIRGLATEPAYGASAEMIAQLPHLEIIASQGVGMDRVDFAAARARGIPVTATPNMLGPAVGELAIALVLACARRVVEADRFVREGKWLKGLLPLGTGLTGKTLGIVGLGQIGSEAAKRAAGFDMTVLYNGPRPKPEQPYEYVPDLVELARRSDVLVIACRGGDETRGIVSAEVIAALGARGILVNVARGSVVDEPALIAALRDGTIASAGLDVFASEPNVSPELLALPNVVVQPHHGSGTLETRTAMGQRVIDNLCAWFAGEALLGQVA